MEVLNKNARRSAGWRIAGMTGLIIVAVVSFTYSMGRSFGSGDNEQLKSLNDSISSLKYAHGAEIAKYKRDIKKMQAEMKQMKAKSGNEPNAALLQQKLEIKDETIENLKIQLQGCQADLANCN